MNDTLVAVHIPLPGKDVNSSLLQVLSPDGGTKMLSARLENGQLVNISTPKISLGAHKPLRSMFAKKKGKKYAKTWLGCYLKGELHIIVGDETVKVKHLSLFIQDEGGPPPKAGSLNYVAASVAVINHEGVLYLAVAQ